MRNDGRNEGRERGMLEMGVATQRWCALSRSISQSPSDDDDYECEHGGREKETRLDDDGNGWSIIMGNHSKVLVHLTTRCSAVWFKELPLMQYINNVRCSFAGRADAEEQPLRGLRAAAGRHHSALRLAQHRQQLRLAPGRPRRRRRPWRPRGTDPPGSPPPPPAATAAAAPSASGMNRY